MREARLQLFVNQEHLGTLTRLSNRSLELVYHPTWIERHPSLPLSRTLPVQEEAHRGTSVETYLKNLLPDSVPILDRIAAIHGIREVDTFSLLRVMGHDCVGAVRFLSDEAAPPAPFMSLKRDPISESEIQTLLKNLEQAPLGQRAQDEFFRISIAGAQEKTALLRDKGTWFKPRGPTPTTHILKPGVHVDFDGVTLSITPENEWLCLKICELFGLRVAKAWVETFGDERALVVERFDRAWSKDHKRLDRLMQEDLCQATGTPPHLKYESRGGPGAQDILDILLESKDPLRDRAHFFKSHVVFFLLAAIDGHAKNFSLQWTDDGFSLSPLYDVVSAEPFVATKKLSEKKLALAMAVHGKRKHYRISEIAYRHFEETARRAKLSAPHLKQVFEDVLTVSEKLPELLAPHLPKDFPPSVVDPILDGIRRRRRVLETGLSS